MPTERLSILVVMAASSFFLFLFVFYPATFNGLSKEDGFVEWSSAILFFASSIIMAIAISNARNSADTPKGTQITLIGLALIFFVIAMEEVSWFQRVLEIETPTLFGSNLQNEMNFHNFATNKIENLYYFGAFAFLVTLPLLRLIFPLWSNSAYFKIFIPRPFIAIVGSVACAYNYDMWNIVFIQITFFGSVATLIALLLLSSNSNDKISILFVIVLITLTQLLFLLKGINFDRRWEVTEYKEFFIPLAFFIYAFDLFAQIRSTSLKNHAQ